MLEYSKQGMIQISQFLVANSQITSLSNTAFLELYFRLSSQFRIASSIKIMQTLRTLLDKS